MKKITKINSQAVRIACRYVQVNQNDKIDPPLIASEFATSVMCRISEDLNICS